MSIFGFWVRRDFPKLMKDAKASKSDMQIFLFAHAVPDNDNNAIVTGSILYTLDNPERIEKNLSALTGFTKDYNVEYDVKSEDGQYPEFRKIHDAGDLMIRKLEDQIAENFLKLKSNKINYFVHKINKIHRHYKSNKTHSKN